MAKNHGSRIKDDERYEALRKQGASKEKAARIANTGRRQASKRGGKSPAYEHGARMTFISAPRKSVSRAARG